MNFSIKYWTFKDSNINPMSRPINIQKNIYINNAKLKLKSARGNKQQIEIPKTVAINANETRPQGNLFFFKLKHSYFIY